MDLKTKNILLMYKNILENDEFLETDIIGFLIFIRKYIDKGKYNQIYDMCDFIAHRFRNDGIIVNNLNNAINNNYIPNNKKRVIGVNGFEIEKLNSKWIDLCNYFGIKIDKRIARNIMICYCSLLQCSKYELENNKMGIIQFLQGVDNSLNICIKENKKDAPMICFMKIPNCKFVRETYYGFIYETLNLKRCNGKLVFINSNNDDYIYF